VTETFCFQGPTCQTPGCLVPVFVDGSGVASKHCSKRHRQQVFYYSLFRSRIDKSASRWAVRGCISCRAAPRTGTLVMCQPCHDAAVRLAPVIIEVPGDHDNYGSGERRVFQLLMKETDPFTVEKQFQQTWRHGTTCPEVRAVYKIIHTTASLKKYEQYLCVSLALSSSVASIY